MNNEGSVLLGSHDTLDTSLEASRIDWPPLETTSQRRIVNRRHAGAESDIRGESVMENIVIADGYWDNGCEAHSPREEHRTHIHGYTPGCARELRPQQLLTFDYSTLGYTQDGHRQEWGGGTVFELMTHILPHS